jgi:hypothetical protein
MRRTTSRRLRRYAKTIVIAVAPVAIMAAYATNLLVPTEPLPKPVSYEVIPTVAIDNSADTIGIADSDIWGVSDPDGTISEEQVDKQLDELQALGVDTIRVLIPWSGIQPIAPGTFPPPYDNYFDWSRSDYIINEAAARGMAVLGVLNSTPNWGGEIDPNLWGPGAAPDPEKFAEFAALAADRYAGKVSAYEVWNEPNYFSSWLPTPDPVAYTELLKAAYTSIKAVDPDALVVGGVLGAVTSFGGLTYNTVDFVEQMYANGAKGYFDALSYHPYQYTTKFSEGVFTPEQPWNYDSPLNQLIRMRQLMIDNGDEALRIWATEYGLPTAGANGVTEQQQADFIEDFLDAWDDLDYAGPAFIYTTIDRMDGTEDGSFGVFYSNWAPKLAAQVIKDAIAANQSPGPDPGPDLGEAIGQALAALYQQWFNALAEAYVNALAQALADMFAGPATTTLALPADTRAAVAEGTTAAALSVSATTEAETPTEDVADEATADLAAAEVAPAEEVPAVEAEVTETEVTAVDAEVTEVKPAEGTEAVTEKVASEVPAEGTETVTEEPTTELVETEEPTTVTGDTASTEAATPEPKAADDPTTPATRKGSEDESKKDSDNKLGDDNDADGATSGGKREAGNVTNGTSVDEIKAKRDKETVTAGVAAASAEAAPAA